MQDDREDTERHDQGWLADEPASAPPDIEPAEHYVLDGGAPTGQRSDVEYGSSGAVPASMTILILCALVFLMGNVLGMVPTESLVFSPGRGLVFPGLVTHMFAHGGFMHLVGNMFVLIFLGTTVERRYGTGKYLVLYFAAGLFAALAESLVSPTGLLLGASGALAGVMAAFVRHYPRTMLYLYGILPLPAWLVMLLWMGYNIWGALGANTGGVQIAFVAHVGGFAAGWLISLLLEPPAATKSQRAKH